MPALLSLPTIEAHLQWWEGYVATYLERDRYLNLLEATHLFERVPPYLGNRTTRLLKSPRGFWADVGWAVFLAGDYGADELAGARELGSFFDTFITNIPRPSEESLYMAAAPFDVWMRRSLPFPGRW